MFQMSSFSGQPGIDATKSIFQVSDINFYGFLKAALNIRLLLKLSKFWQESTKTEKFNN